MGWLQDAEETVAPVAGGAGGALPSIPGIGGLGIPGMGGGGGGGIPGLPGMPGFNDPMGIGGAIGAYGNYQKQMADDRANRIRQADQDLLNQFGGKIPQMADRTSMLQNGQLTGGAYLDPNKYQGNTGALNTLNAKATQEGASPWLQLQLQKQNMDQMNQMAQAAKQSAGATAAARSNLAMRGGLSGGAAERLARGGSQDLNAQRQNIMNQGAQNRINLGIQDESNKNQLLGQAVSANQAQNAQNIGIGQFNAQNTLAENNANNAFNMSKYQEQMKAYGAGKSANAIANGGKK